MRRMIAALLLTVLAALFALPAAAGAAPQLPPVAPDARTRCFPETGECVSDPILRYWERNGGVAVFGYPITSLNYFDIEGQVVPAQWFERDRLEDHSAKGQGVLAGRLGARLLELQGRPWQTFTNATSGIPGCRFFPQTGHSLCQPFLGYWERNGGVDRFGYPITSAFVESVNGWTGSVQYFERRRMEHHTELAGTPYEILLGLLGREVFDISYLGAPIPAPGPIAPPKSFPLPAPAPAPGPFPSPLSSPGGRCLTEVMPELQSAYARVGDFRATMGCPLDRFQHRPAAVQPFQSGQMLWMDLDGFEKRIYGVPQFGYSQYADTWRDGDPVTPSFSAPPGLLVPQRGFGKVWGNDAELRLQLGYGVAAEWAATVSVQEFEDGAMVWLHENDVVYVFGSDERNAQILNR